MLNICTRKIVRDLWNQKARTLLITLTIAIGVFSVGSLARAWVLLAHNLTNNYMAANPASAIITTQPTFDDRLVQRVQDMAAVREAEGYHSLAGRVRVAPDRWHILRLSAYDANDPAMINQFRTEEGQWPPAVRTMLLERSALALAPGIPPGQSVLIEMDNGQRHMVEVAGTLHDITQIPSIFSYTIYGYVTPTTLERLGGSQNYTQLAITMAERPFDQEHIEYVVERVKERLENAGLLVVDIDIPKPGKHALDAIIQSVLLLLALLVGLALGLSVFLVVNSVSALLAQQTRHIGTLKAIGGQRLQITLMYLGMMLVFGVLACSIAIPAGHAWARLNAVFFAGIINFEITDFRIPAYIYGLELLAGLVIPCLAALAPILNTTGMTVREAMGRSGAQIGVFGVLGFERLLQVLSVLPSTVGYSLRNIVRRKVRLVLTLLALSMAGAIFISVVGIRSSVMVAIDEIAAYWQEDISIVFHTPHRLTRIESHLQALTDVTRIEGRLLRSGFLMYADGSEALTACDFFGVQPDSAFIQPRLLMGRWLHPDDTNAMVVNVDLLAQHSDIRIGDRLEFTIDGRRTNWHVVGVVTSQVIGGSELLMAPIAYVAYDHLANQVGATGRVNQILLGADPASDPARLTGTLESQFSQTNMTIASLLENQDVRTSLRNAFAILLSLLEIMSVIFGSVGGLGLMSMMSLNILERTREIGVIRAVGGVRSQIAQMVIIEGLGIGILSAIGATLLALPLGRYLGTVLGETLLQVPLQFRFPLPGAVVWLGLVLCLAFIASLLPAHNAAQLSVRETLAYE